MNKNNLIITILVAIITLGGGFFSGMKYQQSKNPMRQFRGNGQFQNQGDRVNFRPVNGEIIATDNKGITVKLTDGSSKLVMVSETTSINNVATATKNDLKAG